MKLKKCKTPQQQKKEKNKNYKMTKPSMSLADYSL